jgi:uncharacterized protein (TIGR03437 family)
MGLRASSVIALTSGGPQLWPNATLYYTIDPDVPNPQRVLDAIQLWNSQTRLRIVARTSEPNYVEFMRNTSAGAVCEADEGMQGGQQSIMLPDSCTTGMIVHEIGHSWGLGHEQSRNDRNTWVTVLYQMADKRYYRAFDQAPSLRRDVGYYDYDSIMHYPLGNFSTTGLGTLETVPVGIPIGQRTALSAEDIDSVERLYGFTRTTTTITTIPAGLPIMVDGVAAQSPQSYSWTFGSSHTISVDSVFGGDPRYVLVRWTDSGEASHSITASADQTVFCAVFQRMHHVASSVDSGQGSVSVTPSAADGYFPESEQIQLTATPSPGNQFLTWDPPNNVQASGYGLASSAPVVEVFNVNSTFLAHFTTAPVMTVDSQPGGLKVQIDGTSYVAPVSFTWQPGTTHTLAAANYLAGSNTVRYAISHWEDGTTGNTRTITAPSNSATYTATFTPSYLLTTTVNGSGGILASPPSPDGYYATGTAVQLTAQPGAGMMLRYWLGDLNSSDLNGTVTMDQQRAVTAFFNTPVTLKVSNAASLWHNVLFDQVFATVAPGEIVSIFGNFGPAAPVFADSESGSFPVSLADTQVFFDNTPAPILAVTQGQANVVVPSTVGGAGSTLIRVTYKGAPAGSLGISVTPTMPALFTLAQNGQGQIAARNQDNSVNSSSNPAPHGSVIQLFATGGGAWGRTLPDGQVAGADLVHPAAPVYVRVGKLPAQVIYAGTAPTLVNGVLQVNAQLPDDLLGGPAVPIQLIAGDYASPPGTTIAVQ